MLWHVKTRSTCISINKIIYSKTKKICMFHKETRLKMPNLIIQMSTSILQKDVLYYV